MTYPPVGRDGQRGGEPYPGKPRAAAVQVSHGAGQGNGQGRAAGLVNGQGRAGQWSGQGWAMAGQGMAMVRKSRSWC